VLKIPAEEIDEQTSPDNVEAWDSLKSMNLVLALEEEFGVQLTDQQILEMQNVGLILLLLKEALQTV
jgi:acyl carrier protein